ncbi:unnamed protein product [Urochloa humidicola]
MAARPRRRPSAPPWPWAVPAMRRRGEPWPPPPRDAATPMHSPHPGLGVASPEEVEPLRLGLCAAGRRRAALRAGLAFGASVRPYIGTRGR